MYLYCFLPLASLVQVDPTARTRASSTSAEHVNSSAHHLHVTRDLPSAILV